MNDAVMVTGGAGYIGSHIVFALRETGHKTVVLDDLSTGEKSVIPAGVAFVQADCGDAGAVASAIQEHRVGSIIHCAGSIRVEESVSDPLKYYANNTANSRTLIETCVREKVKRVLFSSTAAVYGVPEKMPIDVATELRPINPYGRSKLMTEIMLADASSAYGLRYGALRYFNVAGADQQGRSGQMGPFVSHLIRRALHTHLGAYSKIEVFGTDWPTKDGTCIRDYVHVSDLATAHVLCLDHLIKGGDNIVANCGYGHGFSVREVLRAVESVTGRALPIIDAPRRAGDPPALVADARWLRKTLGWTPRFDDLETIVRDALHWEEKYVSDRGGLRRKA
ncbi:MAG: UDP-glucose 4-epimerase GalE [Pseudomonadota bacterium]|nr:UDP-glucose 4-epimerase GalE [Pseudomonadota bacterium]